MNTIEQNNLLDVLYDFQHKRFVAHFDLLGFKEITTGYTLRDLIQEVKPAIVTAIESAHEEAQQIWTDKENKPVIEKPLWFSDTIIFFTKDISGWSFLSLIMVSINFFCELLAKGFPARGAIACGPFYYESDIEFCFFGGQALIQAYKLEQKQDWCGVMVDQKIIEEECKNIPDLADAINFLKDKKHLVNYHVPMKEELFQKFSCINWPQQYLKLKHQPVFPVVNDMIRRLKKEPLKWPEFRKIKNTHEFYKEMVET